jgi:hypothetical protein
MQVPFIKDWIEAARTPCWTCRPDGVRDISAAAYKDDIMKAGSYEPSAGTQSGAGEMSSDIRTPFAQATRHKALGGLRFSPIAYSCYLGFGSI